MTISTNYFTKVIRDIRADLVARNIVEGLPAPTDEELQIEMDRVFRTMENRTFGNSVLRKSIDASGNTQWYIGNILFSSTVPQVTLPLEGSSYIALSDGDLILSSELPDVYVSANIETVSGDLIFFSSPPDILIYPQYPNGNLILSSESPEFLIDAMYPAGNTVLSSESPDVHLTDA